MTLIEYGKDWQGSNRQVPLLSSPTTYPLRQGQLNLMNLVANKGMF